MSNIDNDETYDNWDDGSLGQSLVNAKASSLDVKTVSDALAMQSINIRMPKGLLEDLKVIAEINNIGYQPLIKQVLQRFVTCEMKQIMRDMADKEQARRAIAEQAAEQSVLGQQEKMRA